MTNEVLKVTVTAFPKCHSETEPALLAEVKSLLNDPNILLFAQQGK